jgi:hypothetical protein
MMLIEGVRIEDLIEFCLIFFLAFLGSFAKDYMNLMNFSGKKMSIPIIIFSAFTASLAMFAISNYMKPYIGIRGLMFLSFTFGLFGFQLLKRISTIEGFFKLVRDTIDLVRDFVEFRKRDKKDKDE